MVLGAVSLLVMALMLMASFSVTNAIHEKIRIQAHADAEAYSVAVLEARTFNVTTHYNRAIAATLVAQMSLHSWMAIATSNVSQLDCEWVSLLFIALEEMGLGCYPFRFDHCPCMFDALKNMRSVKRAAKDWQDKLKQHEQAFNDSVKALKEMADALHTSQKDALGRMWSQFSPNSDLLKALKQTNASASEYKGSLDELNQGEFACALEGSQYDDSCKGRRMRGRSTASARSYVMENAANGARPTFDQKGMGSAVSNSNWDMASGDVPKRELQHGSWSIVPVTVTAGLGVSTSPATDAEGRNVGARTSVGECTVTRFHHSTAGFFYQGSIFSDSNGGQHRSQMTNYDSNHPEFKGEQQEEDPCPESNCFVNYRADTRPETDFGQPSVYGGVAQDLRKYHLKGAREGAQGGFQDHAPWELNDDGKVQVGLVKGDTAVVNYVPRDQGYAVAKAKVYFHQLGNWASPPNFFDPFWRAKLHFFSRDEMQEVLGRVGDETGRQLVGHGAPVEGATQ